MSCAATVAGGREVGNSKDDGRDGAALGELLGSATREAVVAARNALSVALTSVFILRRDIPDDARKNHVAKHLARIDRHLEQLATLIGVATGPPHRGSTRHH